MIAWLVYTAVGIAKHRHNYLVKFMGPSFFEREIFGRHVHFRLLMPVFLVLEIPLDLARILTLAVRLLANMFADHTVVAVWLALVPIGVPAIFMGLGLIVCVSTGIRVLAAHHDLHRPGARGASLRGALGSAGPFMSEGVFRDAQSRETRPLHPVLRPAPARGLRRGRRQRASSSWGYALGAGLAVGLAGLGCGIGQGLTAGNTTAGIARNPGAAGAMFTNFILGMVLIESIAIYGLVIAFLLQGKIA